MVCPVCGEFVPPSVVHVCPGRRTVPSTTAPGDWGLTDGGRIGALAAINEATRSAVQPGGILLYPGSGDDVANAPFATHSRIDVFVFVDNWQGGGMAASNEDSARSLSLKLPGIAIPKRLGVWAAHGLIANAGIRVEGYTLPWRSSSASA